MIWKYILHALLQPNRWAEKYLNDEEKVSELHLLVFFENYYPFKDSATSPD